MNVIDSFYLLFKTNSKEAQSELKKLDDQIAELAAKGNTRSQAETKALGAMRKLRAQSTQDLKDEKKVVDDTTLSFSKLALAGVAALEGFAGLNKLKDGIVNSINYNAQIEKTAKLTNTNARELSLWNDVIARAGGNPGGKEYINFITQLNQKYAALGVNDRIKRVGQDLLNISSQFAEMERNSPGSSLARAEKLGIGPDLWLALKDGPGILQQNIDFMSLLDNTTEDTAKSAFSLSQQWSDIGIVFRSVFTWLQPLAKLMSTFIEGLGFGLRGIEATLQSIFTLSFKPLNDLAAAQDQAISRLVGPQATGSNADESRAYWKSLGYSDAQVAALLANEQAESSFNSGAVGDNGTARGIFQWHGPRRQKILAATGIDVATASHADQLRAAAWELEQTGTASRLRNTATPQQGAAVLTGYEAPANAGYQAYARGQSAAAIFAAGKSALSDASSSPFNSISNSSSQRTITIGGITINTQASDARGISSDLHGELASMVQSVDDGVSK